MLDARFTYSDEEKDYLREGYEAQQALLSPYATRHEEAIYEHEQETSEDDVLVRPAFVRDVDRVLNNAFYNRCMDKTQVFPFYRNDDLTRRSFHLQLVAQIAMKIGSALRLNTSLIQAIALGHDMGHTPFGHGGERMLNDCYLKHTGRVFNHNVHSVRLLRTVANRDLSLQTFNGMLCHCGEKTFEKYEPDTSCDSFDVLDAMMERCYTEPGASQLLRPSTLEGCVVRISDILAYIGKDRQDAVTLGILDEQSYYLPESPVGRSNSAFIYNVTTNLIKNSINKPYLVMDREVFEAIDAAKALNMEQIYHSPEAHETLDSKITPMMGQLYDRFLEDLKAGNEDSYIFRHHLNSWVMKENAAYANEEPNAIVCDYIASMTDEYFINLFNHLFPEQAQSEEDLYVPYFR